MRIRLAAITAGLLVCASTQASNSMSDAWKLYAPMMVAEIYAMSSPTDDNVTVMQARGDYLLTNLGVQPNKRIQSMTQAISVLVTSGKMDGSISDLKDVGLLPELLPDLPQDQPLTEVFSHPSAFASIKECILQGEFGQQAMCQALGFYLSALRYEPARCEVAVLKDEFLNTTGIYPTIIELSRYLVRLPDQQVDDNLTVAASDTLTNEEEGNPFKDPSIDLMMAKQALINAVLAARQITQL